ncbi:MAG: hypothetical protein RBU29_11770 [bacterium]|jgi:hypothetical protein|nr:hypothetical protein [bacterium]
MNCKKQAKKVMSKIALDRVNRILGPEAFQPLETGILQGKIRPGADLWDGRPLQPETLDRGFCYSTANYHRLLQQIQHAPRVCPWCGQPLQAAASFLFSWDLSPSFHPQCWMAHNLAAAIVFGFLSPTQLPLPCAQVVQSQGIQPQVIYPQVMQPQGGMPVPAQPACPPQGKVTIIQKIIQTIKIEF